MSEPVLHEQRRGLADRLSAASGSWPFFWLNAVWFAVWLVVNLATPFRFDPFPFALLTLVVSLEAILLSVLILISQRRQDEADRKIARLDFQTNQEAENGVERLIDHMHAQDERLERIEVLLLQKGEGKHGSTNE
jgi:CRP/FNR family transcriptional regulator, cyclic AMP receptor protein